MLIQKRDAGDRDLEAISPIPKLVLDQFPAIVQALAGQGGVEDAGVSAGPIDIDEVGAIDGPG